MDIHLCEVAERKHCSYETIDYMAMLVFIFWFELSDMLKLGLKNNKDAIREQIKSG